MFEVNKVRADFPILSRQIYGKPLVYLDNAATTQKPKCVVDAITDEYYSVNANVHRGVHFLSMAATELHEQARQTVARFIGATEPKEIVFTRGTTESINLIASSLRSYLGGKGGEVIISTKEHHSNIVPWQLNGFTLKTFRTIADYECLFTPDTKMVSVTHVSNVLGEVTPLDEIVRIAHSHGVPVLIDGAQSVPHFPVNVHDIGCDFFVFSGHKVYGPTGIGVLYGKEKWLDRLPPYQGGGEMIKTVTIEKSTFEDLPLKFEAGTPDYIGSHALAIALDYLEILGRENIHHHEQCLTQYALRRMQEVDGLKVFGCPDDAVISFQVGDIHPLDLGTLLDRLGIAIRTGHHCAQPLMRELGVEGTARLSFAMYNTEEEVDALISAIQRVKGMF
ncbi:MAG: cysteine desulfurase [Prevotella sp.]|nr:cysteine desulfurase [Candidatus Equicola faecalis]